MEVHGKNVLVKFMKGDTFVDWVCAEDCTITFTAELKQVKTRGDGVYKRPRAQSLSWGVELSGVLSIGDPTKYSGEDIIDYLMAMSTVPMQFIFDDADGHLLVYEGDVLPQNSTLSGPAADFSTQTHSLAGAGALQKRNSIETCGTYIDDNVLAVVVSLDGVVQISGAHVVGPVLRWDYQIDGNGDTYTSFTNAWQLSGTQAPIGSHQIAIIPVCPNGLPGPVRLKNFTIA